MQAFEIQQGKGPIILGVPHAGTFVPGPVWRTLNATGQLLADTDWHVDRLYEGLLPDATMVRAAFHRYVIDANRDPAGTSLYPGQNTTGLCPTTDFDGHPIYLDGAEPSDGDIEERRAAWHAKYHAALAGEIERVRARHGIAVLYDCHSIRSGIPFLFEGVLPDFNIGDNGGQTCAPVLRDAVERITSGVQDFTSVTNGRFKGGWTIRHYGRPADGVHAIQMELAQKTYLTAEAPPFAYDTERAERLRGVLKQILAALDAAARSLPRPDTTTGGTDV